MAKFARVATRLQPKDSAQFWLSAPGVVLGLLLFAVVWLGLLSLDRRVAPQDTLEQLTWVRSLQWGYYKHPPLPTWITYLPIKLFGLHLAVAYGLAAACIMAAVALLWRLLVLLRGPTYAAVALLAVLCISYYSVRIDLLNHNTVLMLMISGAAWACWKAFATGLWRWWLALGTALGLAALTKYQAAQAVLVVLLFAAHQRAWRVQRQRQGLLLAALVALVMFSPHAAWLAANDFAPVHYAMDSALSAHLGPAQRLGRSAHWLADQLFNRALGAGLLLCAALYWARRQVSPRPLVEPELGGAAGNGPLPASRAFLLIWGFVPLAFVPVMGLLSGSALPLHWGSPWLLFCVPAVMELCRPDAWSRVSWRHVGAAFLAIQSLIWAASHNNAQREWAAGPSQRRHAFDATAAALQMAEPARKALGGPIKVLIGPDFEATAVAMQLPERPLVLIDGRYDRSPWVPVELVRRCGALELGYAHAMPGGHLLGERFPGFAWRLVPPTTPGAHCR